MEKMSILTPTQKQILDQIGKSQFITSNFYFTGGTVLSEFYLKHRFSEDLDFSLLKPAPDFTLARYGDALRNELGGFGFVVRFQQKTQKNTAIESAFLKTDTLQQMIVLEAGPDIVGGLPPGRQLTIKLEVDTNPPSDFLTEMKYVLQPVPFAVRAYCLPDLFAGKAHAVMYRRWKNRVKGRDWYDLVWYAGHHPELRLRHLEARMRQSGDYTGNKPLTPDELRRRFAEAVDRLNVKQAIAEVEPFVRDPQSLALWSKGFFTEVITRIVPV